MSSDPELEDFKRNIDLREFAAGMGYALDRRDSWRGSAVMRNASDDKIVIKRGADGHFIYFSVRDDRDNGTIIDFLQKREALSLVEVRRALRAWLGRPAAAPGTSLPAWSRLEPTPKNRAAVELRFQKMAKASEHPYLVETRGFSPALLSSPRFAGRIRIDDNRNAVFPHFDQSGLCGYELKNRTFTGFAKGGEKGLWMSHATPEDRRLVFAESAIDALSYAQLFPDSAARYASVGGKLNPDRQPGIIKAAILRMPEGSEIISAMDNDPDGKSLASMIETAVTESSRLDLFYRPHFPARENQDWNDILRQRRPSSFPTARL